MTKTISSCWSAKFPIALCICLLAAEGSANPLLLDWDSLTWDPAGNSNLTQTYSIGGSNVVVTISGNTDELDSTPPVLSPQIDDTNTGGLLPPEYSLAIGTDYLDLSNPEVVITFDFSDFSSGVSNVAFNIFDVDALLSYADELTVTAIAAGVAENPTFIGTGITNSATSANTVLGMEPSAPNSSGGTVSFAFTQSNISEIQIIYRNVTADPNPGFQWINIHDITFQPVPAPGAIVLFASALGGLLLKRRK